MPAPLGAWLPSTPSRQQQRMHTPTLREATSLIDAGEDDRTGTRRRAGGVRRSGAARPLAALVATLALLLVPGAVLAEPGRMLGRPIPAQSLSRALTDLAGQTGLQLIYLSADAASKASPGAPGAGGLADSLGALLAGTDLEFEFLNARTVRIFTRATVTESPTAIAVRAAPDTRAVPVAVAPRPAQFSVVVTAAHVVHAPELPVPLVEPLPLTAGLCVPPELRAARLRRAKSKLVLDRERARLAAEATWELGDAISGSLEYLSRALFTTVIVLDACPPDQAPPEGVGALLLVTLEEGRVSMPEMFSLEAPEPTAAGEISYKHLFARRATLTFIFSLQAPGSPAPVGWRVTGRGVALHTMLSADDDASTALAAALRDVVARSIVTVNRDRRVRRWFAHEGMTAELLQ